MPIDAGIREEVQPKYMGDGVYAYFDGYHLWLTTQEGMRIALEPEVYQAVLAYGAHIWSLKP